MLAQKEAEIKILKCLGWPEQEIPQILKEVENWDFNEEKEFKKLLPCIQDDKPVFQDRKLLILFLQLLRQMRLVWKVIAEKKTGDEVYPTDIHDTLARTRKPGREDYWMLPEFKNRLNRWKYLNVPLYGNGYEATKDNKVFNEKFKPNGKNSARKKIFTMYREYITGEQQ